MSKTQLTYDMEKSIFQTVNGLGIYPAFEVTLGDYYGSDRVDFITMSSRNVFRCYEIKSSLADLKSESILSFVGDYNYFVMPEELYKDERAKPLIEEKFIKGIGLYLYNRQTKQCKLERKAKNKNLSLSDKIALMSCMVRSLSRLTERIINRKDY